MEDCIPKERLVPQAGNMEQQLEVIAREVLGDGPLSRGSDRILQAAPHSSP